MKIHIKDTDVQLKSTFRAHIIYEQITGGTFAPKNLTDIVTFYFSTVMACSPDLALDFNEFLDWLDDNPSSLNDFVSFLTENEKRQNALNPTKAEGNPTKKVQPTKKKK